MTEDFAHEPVLAAEVIALLAPAAGGIYVDGTVGGAGHAAAIAARIGSGGTLIGIDRDLAAIEAARKRLQSSGVETILVHDNFANLAEILDGQNVPEVDGVLLDLGLSSPQVDTAGRGFSYHVDAPLDMRMDQGQFLTAGHLINAASEEELSRIIADYGEERWARRIAAFIARERRNGPIETTGQLAEIIKAAIPAAARRSGPHPARRTFQALRIAVNGELEALRQVLPVAVDHLKPGGRIAVISFHSLEDRIVKTELALMSRKCTCPPEIPICTCRGPVVRVLTKHPVTATPEELEKNPRARSAKLRVAVKLV